MSKQPNQPRSGAPPGHVGLAYFWERLRSRRQFLQTAGATGLALSSGLWLPTPAWADQKPVDPKPIPGTIPLPPPPAPPIGQFHFMFPGPADKGNEPSLITDFNGFIGGIDAVGSGTGKDTTTGVKSRLRWASDTRFMTGVYVGVDGKKHKGTFAFI
jgi:hypothetical protein